MSDTTRETSEEIGFSREKVEVLGKYHDALAITNVAGTQMFCIAVLSLLRLSDEVTPIVGYLGHVQMSSFVKSDAELDEIFTLSLDQVYLHSVAQKYMMEYIVWKQYFELPCSDYSTLFFDNDKLCDKKHLSFTETNRGILPTFSAGTKFLSIFFFFHSDLKGNILFGV